MATSFASIRRVERPAPYSLERDSLATLFELSLGLSAWKQHGGSRWALRCNPSSGNLHPTEGYLLCPTLSGLSAGVYHYLSHDHILEQRAIPKPGSWDNDLGGGVVIALSSVHWREAWKYGLRAYRYCQHDCGDGRDAAQTICCHQEIAADSCFAVSFLTEFTDPLREGPWVYRELFWETGILGQILYLEAEASGIRATGIGCFFDDALHRLLGLKDLAFQSLYHFTVGGAVDDQRLQSLPPYAHLHRLRQKER